MNTFSSKEERHLLYVKALEVYQAQITEGVWYGLCSALYIASGGVVSVYTLRDLCPEIYKHKSKRDSKINPGFWWKISNTKKRIKVLEQVIEETKPVKV